MEMKFFQLGIRLMLTGWTSPPLMRRRLASPDAETRSYCPPPPPPPVRISATMSFDVPASLRWILQPVSWTNLLAKLGSEYAGHSMRLSDPSPLPIFVGRAWPLPAPDAGTQSAAASAATRTCR